MGRNHRLHIIVDGQHKGLEELNRLHDEKQRIFLGKMGLGALLRQME